LSPITGDIRDTNGGGKKEIHHRDESIKTFLYVCIACGFNALDDPGLQFHLKGSRFCLESTTGKKQRTAPPVLSQQFHKYISLSDAGHARATTQLGASPDKSFDYNTPADDGIIFETTNDEDEQDAMYQEQVADKHNIDH
jgi:hypothetical protein